MHVLRGRRTAAVARATSSIAAVLLLALTATGQGHRVSALAGFGILLVSAAVMLAHYDPRWLTAEETVSALAGVLILGFADQQVTILELLWLSAVTSGVLARGGRIHWAGRAVLMVALVLPVLRAWSVDAGYAAFCAGAVALLLTGGRLTRELATLLAQARYDAGHDGLTGALSRAAFCRALDARAGVGEPVGVLVLDLDDFGEVNKAQGQAGGDRILGATVARMRSSLGANAIVGRLGGDEFAAFIPTTDPRGAATRMVAALGRADADADPIGGSVGVARGPEHGEDAAALMLAAGLALRVAKRGGRGQVSTYDGQSLTEQGPDGARGALMRLIAGDGLTTVVQPIVDTTTGDVHACEALGRFQTRGSQSPLHWLTLAEELGLRSDLELACLRSAMPLLCEVPDGACLTVNLSGKLLLDPRLGELMARQEDLSRLIIEVTEDSLVGDDILAMAAVAPLIERGVRLAVDDMGAGYSGLRQVTVLRPSYLKLDRALISGIDASPDRQALVEALVGYAQRTGSRIVAEGIETEAELRAVKALGVDLVQGYLLGRPAPPWPNTNQAEPAPERRPQVAAA